MMMAGIDRPNIADMSKATTDELRATWGPMIANSGVYEVARDLITIHLVVGKIPIVMKPGSFEVYAFIEDKNLFLIQRRNTTGPMERAAARKLVRVE